MGIYAGAYGTGSADNYGGVFDASGGGTGNLVGVRGYAGGSATSNYNKGVEGSAGGLGSSANATNIGVYGEATNRSTRWAGYFASGNVKIENNLELDGELNTSSGGSSNMAPVFYMNVKAVENTGGSFSHTMSYSNSSFVNSASFNNQTYFWEIEMNSTNFNLTDNCIVIVTPQMYTNSYGTISARNENFHIYKDIQNNKIILQCDNEGTPLGFSLIMYKP